MLPLPPLLRYDLDNKEPKSDEDRTSIELLRKEFGKLHGVSSLLNLLVLCGGVAHAWFLAALMVRS